MMKVALIEDDADLAFTIRLNLEKAGYKVQHYDRGLEGLYGVSNEKPDLLVLDLNLPDLDGLTLCRELRREPSTAEIPIIMLTARTSERDRVTGLELGADDYIAKPFSMRELVARTAAVLRRSKSLTSQTSVYEDSRLKVDPGTFRVFVDGEEAKLAKKEFELLWVLIRNAPQVVSRDRLLSEVWQMSDEIETRTVDAHVRNVRKKIGKDRISTVIGTGYRFELPI